MMAIWSMETVVHSNALFRINTVVVGSLVILPSAEKSPRRLKPAEMEL